MRSDIQAALDAIKGPAQAIVTKVDNIPAAVEAGEQQAYNEGFEAGKASIQLPDATAPGVIYTQEQMTAAGPDAVAAFKADLKAKYADQQVAETASETGFAALLD